MIKFFRDVLNGPLYIVVTILSIIFIMAIIGFLMERKKLEKEKQKEIVVIDTQPEITPITPISVQEENVMPTNVDAISSSNFDQNQEDSSTIEVKKPVIVFDDSDQKTE